MLSEDEKEAIRNLENLSEFGLSATLNQADLDKMKTVLNLITKLQKENEDYKYLYEQALDNTLKADKENIQLKKQINLMAEYIATLDIEEDICKNIKNDNCDKMNFGECEYCIKQYFEKLAKEDK